MVRPVRNNRPIHAPRPEHPENIPLPGNEGENEGDQLEREVQQVLGDQVLRPEGHEEDFLGGRAPVLERRPRGRRRLVPADVEVSDTDSEDGADFPNMQPRAFQQDRPVGALGGYEGNQQAGQDDVEEEDELDRALKQKQASNGSWEKHHIAFAAGEAVLCSTSIQALADLPELLSNLPKVGGSGLEQHLSAFRNLWTSWDNVFKNLKYRGLAKKDLVKGEKIALASAQLFRRFLDDFSPISSSPGAVQGIIGFFEDPVSRALLGQEKSSAIAQQLRSFARAQRSLASHSFSTLCRWQPKSQYRAQNQSAGRYHPYGGRSGNGRDNRGSSRSGDYQSSSSSRSGGYSREGRQGGKQNYDRNNGRQRF